ncbi:hypothetical protein J5N97_014066 [Dioscorea zingiberensis]|uniref:Uncharacterized protein n=1 Tax=Dioscorea zingiberensis TaxID=325984 RepID=A0A9D5CTA4_9LILI|nr:hypothetical protein J5N97_014066 [Dioscorea zingiberensis]
MQAMFKENIEALNFCKKMPHDNDDSMIHLTKRSNIAPFINGINNHPSGEEEVAAAIIKKGLLEFVTTKSKMCGLATARQGFAIAKAMIKRIVVVVLEAMYSRCS